MFNSYIIPWCFPAIYFFYFFSQFFVKIYLFYSHILQKFLRFLKHHIFSKYSILCDICVLDWLNLSSSRFELIYNLWSLKYRSRCLISTKLLFTTHVQTIMHLYSNANWCEREIWEMFGIFFFDHYNLTRLLTDYGFLGMPLKKDFPLSGYFELFFLDSTSSINYIPIEMSQEFRVFKFLSPWEQV